VSVAWSKRQYRGSCRQTKNAPFLTSLKYLILNEFLPIPYLFNPIYNYIWVFMPVWVLLGVTQTTLQIGMSCKTGTQIAGNVCTCDRIFDDWVLFCNEERKGSHISANFKPICNNALSYSLSNKARTLLMFILHLHKDSRFYHLALIQYRYIGRYLQKCFLEKVQSTTLYFLVYDRVFRTISSREDSFRSATTVFCFLISWESNINY